jgi:hypothetical protein
VSSFAIIVSRSGAVFSMNLSRELRSLQADLITFASSYTYTLEASSLLDLTGDPVRSDPSVNT